MQFAPLFGGHGTHGLRAPVIGNARYEIRRLDLLSEEEARRIIRFRDAVHGEAPWQPEQSGSEITGDRPCVGEMVVDPRDAAPLQFAGEDQGLSEIDERHAEWP